MSLAKDLRDRVNTDPNLEFAGGGYRLSLNPIEDRHTETGFVLWHDQGGAPAPIASGRAVGDDLVVDRSDYDGDLEALIRDLIAGEPVAVSPRPDPDNAVPTGT